MPLSDYRPPVAQLLALGDPLVEQDEISYRQLGLSEVDVPELSMTMRPTTSKSMQACTPGVPSASCGQRQLSTP